ncbi:hypothetical protein SAMN04488089_102241 [Myroides profundi]|uniref:SHOCT domain-containing protein n=2 Tax=Myroides profundi TaxID=480520 RepID=A0AAJ5BCZ9_MYRPR|nr:hypothetical protein SAMN04488089_102241 [Myroides profundi]
MQLKKQNIPNMKKLFSIIVLLNSTTFFAQTADYGKIRKGKETFTEYISKNGDLIKVGDTLIIGRSLDADGFRFINQNGEKMYVGYEGKKYIPTKIQSHGKEKTGISIWLRSKSFGQYSIDIDYENALSTGEIINPKGRLTKEQAINKLKEKKELLDLQIITQEEYDRIKEEMVKYIN